MTHTAEAKRPRTQWESRRTSRLDSALDLCNQRSEWKTGSFVAQMAAESKVSEFGTVVFEDLKVKNMTASAAGTAEEPGSNVAAKSGLNRIILGAGWGMLVVFTGEQTTALKVPAYNSSLECSNCGHIAKVDRPNRDTFICVVCHHQDHADLSASDVIEARGNRVLAGDGQPASVVARRSRKAPGTKNEEAPAHAA